MFEREGFFGPIIGGHGIAFLIGAGAIPKSSPFGCDALAYRRFVYSRSVIGLGGVMAFAKTDDEPRISETDIFSPGDKVICLEHWIAGHAVEAFEQTTVIALDDDGTYKCLDSFLELCGG